MANQEEATLNQKALQNLIERHVLNSGGLAIASSATQAKTANDVYYFISGSLYKKASTDGLGALSGTVSNGNYNVFVISVDSSGNIAINMGTAGSSLSAVTFPSTPSDEAVIGFIIVHPSGTGDFVGGTTDLNDGTVTPNAVYIDAVPPMRFA